MQKQYLCLTYKVLRREANMFESNFAHAVSIEDDRYSFDAAPKISDSTEETEKLDDSYDVLNEIASTITVENTDEVIENDVVSEEIERLTEVELIGVPYTRNNPYAPQKEAKEITFGTTQVAQMLGITAQTVRNYIDDYNDYLNISIVSAGSTRRAMFTRNDIEKLRQLMKVKDENNYTTEQMREYLGNPNHVGAEPENRQVDKAVELLIETVKNLLEESNKNYCARIEQQDQQYGESINALNDVIKQQNTQIADLKSAMEKQSGAIEELKEASSASHEREISSLKQQHDEEIDRITKANNENKRVTEEVISSLTAQNEELQSKLAEQEEQVNKEKEAVEKLASDNEAMNERIKELEALATKKKKFLGIF